MDYVPLKNKLDLLEKYKLIFISRSLNFEQKESLKNFCLIIGFLCYISLKYYNYDNFFKDELEILNFYSDLFFTKEFYENVYFNQLKEDNYIKYNQETKEFFFKDLYPKYINDKSIKLSDLFSKEEIELFEQTLNSIKQLYNEKNIILLKDIKIYNLNELFSIPILRLQIFKNKYIKNAPINFRNNLIHLEKEILKLTKSNFRLEGEKKLLNNYIINKDVKKIFISFSDNLKKTFSKYKFDLYPYGSITEFLSSKKSDLDIYLEIKDINIKPKYAIDFLKELDKYLYNTYKSKSIISKRICIFKIKYKNLDIDLSILGFSPYLHSSIFRSYSLMDSRFPILVYIIKYLVKKLGIKYEVNENNSYLNSFSWVLLIISFLQDIIDPPILPKLFENCSFIKKNIFFGDIQKKKFGAYDFNDFIYGIKTNTVKIPNGDLEEYKKIYIEFKKNNNNNNLSVSELLLSFLEFIIYFYKYDVLYHNFSFNGKEGIINRSNILNYEDPIYKDEYYLKKYLTFNSKDNNIRDGVFLFRDPFDSHYNPGQTFKFKDIDNFFNKLEFAYKTLIETGSIEKILENGNE